MAFDLYNSNSYILETKTVAKRNLWAGGSKGRKKEHSSIIISENDPFSVFCCEDPISFLPKCHSLNKEATYSLIFNAPLSCFLLEIVWLKNWHFPNSGMVFPTF